MVGIGTAAILLLFILFITVKSLARCLLRKWRGIQYNKRVSAAAAATQTALTVLEDNTIATVHSDQVGLQQTGPNSKRKLNGDLI